MDGERQIEIEQREVDVLRIAAGNQRLEYEPNELLTQVKEKIHRELQTQKAR